MLTKSEAAKLKARISILSNQSYNAGSGAAAHLTADWVSEKVAIVHRMVDELTDSEEERDTASPHSMIDTDTVQYAIRRIDGEHVAYHIPLAQVSYLSIEEWLDDYPLKSNEHVMRRLRLTPSEGWEGWHQMRSVQTGS